MGKIYTKTGDEGKTSLIGGKRVYKFDKQVEAYGTIDELISYIGLIRSHFVKGASYSNWKGSKCVMIYPYDRLLTIQSRLMVCASIIATENGADDVNLPKLKEADLNLLESEIDIMDEALPTLTSFVLPGGSVSSAQCNVARTVCRRAERQIIEISINYGYVANEVEIPETLNNEDIVIYLNRLSDYLFTLGRFINYNESLWDDNQ